MNHPRLSIIFSSLHPPFLPLSKIRRDPGRTLCCTSLRPEKEEKGETERNIRQTSLRNLFRAFPTLSMENGSTYQSILSFHREISDSFRVWIVFPLPLLSIHFLVDISFPQFFRIIRQTCCLSARRERTKQRDVVSRRDRRSYDISLGRYFSSILSIPIKLHSSGVQEGLKYLKKRGVVVQRRKARVRNKNTFERKFKVDYLAAQDYTLRPASLVISRDKRREERRETY